MIDLHIHILPGMDDGAETMEDALEMAKISLESGVDTVVASSHGDLHRYEPEEFLEKYERRYRDFCRRLAAEHIPLKICRGAEWLVNDSLLHCIRKRKLPTINGGGYLLAEFYFDSPLHYVMEALEQMTGAGYKLILAHPERYDFAGRHLESLFDLYREGVVLQVNKGSLAGEFGRRAFRAADYMLANGLAGAVASDAHGPVMRNPELSETAEILDIHYGNNASDILLTQTPRHILRNAVRRIKQEIED